MTSIGLVSDTHTYIDDKLLDFFADCDEVWHAGDIGNTEVLDVLKSKFDVKAVFGNIDDTRLRSELPEIARFKCEEMDVFITHIGGYPGNYYNKIRKKLEKNPPDIFISGHSHILKIMNDKKLDFLHINPGAYGKSGLHQVRTAVRFKIDKNEAKDLEILELKR